MNPKDKLKAQIDDLIAKAFGGEDSADDQAGVSKSLDEIGNGKEDSTDVSLEANGGGDVIKNKDKKDAAVKKMKKVKEEDDDLEDEEDNEDEDDDKESMEKKKTMKKAITVTEEDFEILQKAKADAAVKAKEDELANDPVLKSISGLTDLVKSQADTIKKLSEDLESIKKSPAREPKSLSGYKAIEKSGGTKEEAPLRKSQVLDTLWELQKAGKVQDIHVCEYEATGNIQDREIKTLLKSELDKAYGAKS